MKPSDFQLTVLGARGSMASARPELACFGGDSPCYMLRAGETTLFLDAGSGMLRAPAAYPGEVMILLSHLHLDHVIGLGMFPAISNPAQRLRIYVPFCRTPEEAEERMNRLYSPPFWPLKLSAFESRPELLPAPERLRVGELSIETTVGNHPNGCLVYRIEYRGRSLVYATDYEYEKTSFDRLAAFSHGADLLLYDGQYTEEEYPARRGFGHSTPQKGLELLNRSRAKRLLLVHHDPRSTDEMLLEREKELPDGLAAYARQGQVISL